MPLIITLSAIPPRFAALGPTLRALLRQRHPADEIRLNIPERYRRFPEWDGTLPEVPEGVTILRCAQDYGPATKLLPRCWPIAATAAEMRPSYGYERTRYATRAFSVSTSSLYSTSNSIGPIISAFGVENRRGGMK